MGGVKIETTVEMVFFVIAMAFVAVYAGCMVWYASVVFRLLRIGFKKAAARRKRSDYAEKLLDYFEIDMEALQGLKILVREIKERRSLGIADIIKDIEMNTESEPILESISSSYIPGVKGFDASTSNPPATPFAVWAVSDGQEPPPGPSLFRFIWRMLEKVR